MKRLLQLGCACTLVASLLALANQVGSHPAPPASPAVSQDASPAVKAYVDPKTGRIGPPPVGAARAATPVTPAVNTSHAGLVEEPGRGPGGGVIVDLQGRFRNHATAAVGTNGQLATRCEEPGVKK